MPLQAVMANTAECQRPEVAGAAAAGTLSSDDVEERQPMLWASEAAARSARRWAPLAAGACLLAGGAAWRGWQSPSGSTLRSTDEQAPLVVLEQQGEWDARWGFNCANGQGADALWEGAEGEIDGRIEFTLEECQQECKSRMPTCQGFITINDENRPDLAHRCWLRTNIHPENCFQGTPYNLWIWTGPAYTPSQPQQPENKEPEAPQPQQPEKKAEPEKPKVQETTAAPASTTARATPAPAAPTTKAASKGGSAVAKAEAGGSAAAGSEAVLWAMSEPNKFCKNRNLEDSVSGQAECQDLCVADDECVGIAYTNAEGLSKYCYLCHDDNLIPSANDFGFYRKVEPSQDDAEAEAAEQAAHEAPKPASGPKHAASHKDKAHEAGGKEAGSKHAKGAEQQKPGEKVEAEGKQDKEDTKKHAGEDAKPAKEEEAKEQQVEEEKKEENKEEEEEKDEKEEEEENEKEDGEQEEEEEEEEKDGEKWKEGEKWIDAPKKNNKKQKHEEKTRSEVQDVEKKLEEELDPDDVAVR